jgi:glycosyltransferase involved in cell wall biosynthesis
MKASIIIPTYNRSEILKFTLSSLVKQDFPSREYEVIVIDDGSSDNTRELVQSFKKELNLIYYFQEDKGFRVALARNEGIKRATGDVLIFIDTGIVVGDTFVREHYNAHYQDKKGNLYNSNEKYAVIGYVYGFSYEYKEDSLPEFIDFNRPNQMIQKLKETNYFHDMREAVYTEINDDMNSIPVPWVVFFTNNISVGRFEMLEAGCFDEEFVRWGVEDVECAYRLLKNNIKFKLSREACGVHYPHERHIEDNFTSGRMNMRKFYSKHQDDEVELFTTSNTFAFIQEYIKYLAFKEKLGKVPLYSSLLTEDALKILAEEIAPQKNILFGCQDGLLLDVCKSSAGTESDMDLFLKLREKYSSIEIHRSLGVRTPFKVNSFNISLIAGAGLVLDSNFINKLIMEAFRVSKKVYWLKLENGTDVTDYTYFEIKDLGNGVRLYQIEQKPHDLNKPDMFIDM